MKCSFIKPDGTSCEANATNGSSLCFTHNPEYVEEKALAVVKGGLNRKLYGFYGEPKELESPKDIRDLVGVTINGVWTGKIPSNSPANTIGFLARCWLDANEQSALEDKISI